MFEVQNLNVYLILLCETFLSFFENMSIFWTGKHSSCNVHGHVVVLLFVFFYFPNIFKHYGQNWQRKSYNSAACVDDNAVPHVNAFRVFLNNGLDYFL